MSHVTYSLSLMPTTIDPHPSNSTIMQSRLVRKDPKPKQVWKTQKNYQNAPKKGILSFWPEVSSALGSSCQRRGHTYSTHFYMDITDTKLNWPRSLSTDPYGSSDIPHILRRKFFNYYEKIFYLKFNILKWAVLLWCNHISFLPFLRWALYSDYPNLWSTLLYWWPSSQRKQR